MERSFNGWQMQTKLDTHGSGDVGGSLSVIGNQPIRTWCAGRTDTAVHASGQIVHFDDPVGRSLKSWVLGVNSELPDAVSVHWAGSVSSDFMRVSVLFHGAINTLSPIHRLDRHNSQAWSPGIDVH